MDTERSKPHKSGKRCSVLGCMEKQGPMFIFPKDETKRLRWREATRIIKDPSYYSYVCIRHFCGSDIITTGNGARRLKKNAIPTLHLPADDSLIKKKERHSCIVRGCSYGLSDGVTLHNFPASIVRQEEWKAVVKVENVSQYTRICSRHFEPSNFREFSDGRRVLSSDAFPSLHLPGTGDDSGCQGAECMTSKSFKIFCKKCQVAEGLRGQPIPDGEDSGSDSVSDVKEACDLVRDPEELPVSEVLSDLRSSVLRDLSDSEAAEVGSTMLQLNTTASDNATSPTGPINALFGEQVLPVTVQSTAKLFVPDKDIVILKCSRQEEKMPARCALLGCKPGEKPKLHKFPANKVLAELWANFVSEHNVSTGKGPGKPYTGATVCTLHFIPTCYKTSSGRLAAGSVPSIPPQQVFSPSTEETNMSQNKESKESNAEGQSGAEDVCPSEIVTKIRDEESLDPDGPDDPDVDGPTLPSKRKRSLFNEFEAMEEGSKMDCEAAPLPNIEECEVSTGSVKEAATPPPSKPPQSEPLSPGEIESLMRETSRKKYPGDITEDDFVSPHSRRRAFNILQDALAESKRELANTKKSFKRLEQKYKTLQDIVMELRKNNFLSIEGQQLLEVKLKF